jgi:PAS domain S-box-containing protein
MQKTDLSVALCLERLSEREREIVLLAIEGRTDEQIAQAMLITASTVNSYWVRVRGKIGQLSRTEIVGMVLREEMAGRFASMQAAMDALRAEARASREAQSRAEAALVAAGGVAWPLLALESLAGATLVVERPGVVRYANPRALRLLGMDHETLAGRSVWDLTLGEDQPIWEAAVRRFFDDPDVRQTVAGVERAQFARRGDGTTLRVTLVANAFETPEGAMAVVSFRECSEDVEIAISALRQCAFHA